MSKYRLKEKENIFCIYSLTLEFASEYPYCTIFFRERVYIASRKPIQYFCSIFINLSKLHYVRLSPFARAIQAKHR